MTDTTQFSFATPRGLFGNPTADVIMTEHGFGVFKERAEHTREPQRTVILNTIIPALERLSRQEAWSDNEAPNDIAEAPADGNRYAHVSALVVARVGTEMPRFDPGYRKERNCSFTSNPATWGWDEAKILLDNQRVLNAHATACGVTVRLSALKMARRRQEEMDQGVLSVRAPDPASDLGQGTSFAIYRGRNDGGGYATADWQWGALNGARLFETAAAAERCIKNNFSSRSDDITIVAITLALTSVVPRATQPQNNGPLQEALAQQQRRQIQEALDQADVSALRARLAVLEGPTPEPTIPRKKM